MRSTKLLLASSMIALFVLFLFQTFSTLDETVDVGGGRAALGAFEFFGIAVSLYLLSKGQPGNISLLDWLVCGSVILVACAGFAGASITTFAVYLLFRSRDPNTKAAGTVAGAIAVQAVWAPLLFSKLSFIFLQIDAGVVGWLISHFVPGASWGGTVVFTPSGHNVEITPACASFHNLSLASLCWVTLTMLHRPYWLKSDLYVGLAAMVVQFAFNIWRLVFVCLSAPMYDFWHDGFGKHIFSAVATACAIILVQIALVRRDQRGPRGATAIS
jgi:exosortase/archaeosortase family protein